MGVLDCIAGSPREYVDCAVRLGTDADYRHHVSRRITSAASTLFEDLQSVREFERFFNEAIESWRTDF